MNRLFVANKPAGMVCNHFLGRLKRKYGVKKAGFSGTLDPFASGCLIVAFGAYTRLFNYLDKAPKTYRATIWFGASSPSFDTENIKYLLTPTLLNEDFLASQVAALTGKITYTPPKFSAKKIEGKRAYELARSGADFSLKPCEMTVFSAKILHYRHPFLSVELSVSEGAYIRSWAQLLAQNIGIPATLCSLHRVSEGAFFYQNEAPLDPLKYLKITPNHTTAPAKLTNGQPLNIEELKIKKNGLYFIESQDDFCIIEVADELVSYRINRIAKC